MGRIRILDEVVANQIAAGEVVERPASVAKELLENALDAGATAITVEVDGGGVERLRVVDNGHGMGIEDATIAFQRHATSKLTQAADLNHIATLGFRGEALPSIASVCKVSVRTREPDALGASLLRIEGGRLVETTQAAGPVGTEFVVEDLFYNVPARRKFLKKPATEASHIQEAVQRLALCYPQVAFRLVKDGKTAIDFPRHDSLATRVGAVFGRRVCGNLIPVDVPGPFGLDGLLGPPDEARATARHYHTFINGRYVRDRVLMSAVQSAYSTRLPRGRHPFVVLRLRLPAEAVDVNVHPAKTEVRFVDTSAVHKLVARALGQAVEAASWGRDQAAGPRPQAAATAPSGASIGPTAAGPGGLDAHRRRIFDAMEQLAADRLSKQAGRDPRQLTSHSPAAQLGLGVPQRATWTAPEHPPASYAPTPEGSPHPSLFESPTGQEAAPMEAPATVPVSAFTADSPGPFIALEPMGQAGGLLWGRAADGLIGVHAARATRALALAALFQPKVDGASLDRPVRLELDRPSAERLRAHQDTLSTLGIVVEPFGGGTYVVERAPTCLDWDRLAEALPAAIEAGAEDGEPRAAMARCLAEYAAALAPQDLVSRLSRTPIPAGATPAWCVRLNAHALEQLLQ